MSEGPRTVYRVNEAIPEIGAERDDIILVEPRADPPVLIIRERGAGAVEIIGRSRASLTLTAFHEDAPPTPAAIAEWYHRHAPRAGAHLTLLH